LWELYHQGDLRAFRELWWTRHRAVLEARARQWSGHDDARAGEALDRTEVKLRRPKAWKSYVPTNRWLPWASRVLLNTVKDMYRRDRRHKTTPLEVDNLTAPAIDNNLRDWDIEVDDVTDCLNRLLPQQRKILILHFYEDKGTNEIAGQLGIPNYSVSKSKTSALDRLRRCLSRKMERGRNPR
jgi:RNA polymerase sigma factor (sigma-70 family)